MLVHSGVFVLVGALDNIHCRDKWFCHRLFHKLYLIMHRTQIATSSAMMATLLVILAAIITDQSHAANQNNNNYNTNYGVDVSFPIHYNFMGHDGQTDRTTSVFGSEHISTYYNYIVGCIEKYTPTNQGHLCQQNENTRLEYNLHQPRAVQNHTELGLDVVHGSRILDQHSNRA